MSFLLKEEKENLLTEYHVLKEEILDRDYKTWVINAILIIGSLIAAFASNIENFQTAILSIILIATAVVLHATSERLNIINHHRIQEITKQLRIIGPNRMYEDKIAGQWWYSVRRNIAYALFAVLISIYLFIILSNLYVLAISIFAGLTLIVINETFRQNLDHYQKLIT